MAYEPDETIDEIAATLGKAADKPVVDPNTPPTPPAAEAIPLGEGSAPPPPDLTNQTPPVPPAGSPPAAADEKQWWEDETPAAPPAGQTPPPNQPVTQPQADPVFERYKTVINDPQVQFLLDQRLAGKSIFEIQKEITIVDYDNMDPTELFKRDLETYGATPEQIATRLEEFSRKEPWEQKKEVEPLRAYHKTNQAQKMQNLNAQAQKTQEEEQKISQKINQEIQAYIPTLKDKDFYGYKPSDAEINQAVQDVAYGISDLKNPDGTPNVTKHFEAALWFRLSRRVVQAAVKKATANGARGLADEITNGSKVQSGSNVPINVKGSLEDDVKKMEDQDNKRFVRN